MPIPRVPPVTALLALLGASPILGQGAPVPVVVSLPASVRFAGLGGAGVPVIGGAGSIFVNPAGLAAIQSVAVEGAYHRYAGGATQSMAAVALRMGQFDFGAGAHLVRLPDSAAARDNALYVATATYRFGVIALGGSLKYVSVTDTARRLSSAVTGDLGTTIAFFDIMALALSIQDLGQRPGENGGLALPTTTHAGITFNFVDPQGTIRLRGILESVWTEGARRRTLFGAEAGVALGGITVTGRMGYGAQPPGSNASETSYGASIAIHHLAVDWAWQARTALGRDAERIGLRWTL